MVSSDLLVTIKNIILPGALLVSTAGIVLFCPKQFRRYAGWIFILLAILEYGYFFNKYQPFSPAKFVFPDHPVFDFLKRGLGINRYFGVDTAYVDNNFATYYRLSAPEGYDPLYIKRYGEFVESSDNGSIPANLTRSDAYIGKIDNYRRERVFDILGVKYILDKADDPSKDQRDQETYSGDRFHLAWRSSKWKAYERKSVLPRIFLTNKYEVIANKKEIIRRFYDKNFDYRNTLILERDPKVSNEGVSGTVQLIKYEPEKIVAQTESTVGQLLFLSDSYYPGWKVYIDDKEGLIYRADYAFRAVVVPAGKHQVMFVYDPLSFRTGLIISILAMGFMVIIFARNKYEKRY